MTGRGTNWVDEALREHEEHTAAEQAATRDADAGAADAGAADAGAADAGAAGTVARSAGPPATPSDREQQVLDRIDRARRRRPRVREERITMSHGAGGKATQTLIQAVFLDAFRNPLLEPLEDAAQLQVGGSRLALTTDTYVVSPLFFPGGNIGDLAVNGTVNDLAVSGATPLYLSAGFVLEEGFPVADLTTIVASMTAAAAAAGVQVVTGDTKVVERGKAAGCYINNAGSAA
jgi:hydrogenase expression/formation protein HypE